MPRNTTPAANDFIELAKQISAQVVFTKVEDVSEILFDVKTLKESDISFLKSMKAAQIKIEEPQDGFFKVTNANGEFIKFSNRLPTNNELRGPAVRGLLLYAKRQTPESSLYAVLNNAVTNPHSNSAMAAFKAQVKRGLFNPKVESAHFNLFITTLIDIVVKKNQKDSLDGITYKQIIDRDNHQVMEKIWKDVNVNELFELSKNFNPVKNFREMMEKLSRKSGSLRARGYTEESETFREMLSQLVALEHKIKSDPDKFYNDCIKVLNNPKYSSLAQFRGMGKIFNPIYNFLIILYNFLTPLAINAEYKKPDTIVKINEVKQALFTNKTIIESSKNVINDLNDETAQPQDKTPRS